MPSTTALRYLLGASLGLGAIDLLVIDLALAPAVVADKAVAAPRAAVVADKAVASPRAAVVADKAAPEPGTTPETGAVESSAATASSSSAGAEPARVMAAAEPSATASAPAPSGAAASAPAPSGAAASAPAPSGAAASAPAPSGAAASAPAPSAASATAADRAQADRAQADRAQADRAQADRAQADPAPVVLSHVYFATMSATLDAKARTTLDALAVTGAKVVLEGHADERGADSYNSKLSRKRALAVQQYLVGRGAERARIEVRYAGEVGAEDPDLWRDRRVDIQITGGPR